MKALWNKICRIFTNQDKIAMASRKKKSGIGNTILRFVTGDTETKIVSGHGADIVASQSLSEQFANKMNRKEKVFTVEEHGRVFKFKKLST